METVSYKGRSIHITITKIGGSRFTWQFQVDDGPVSACEGTPLSTELMARDEAVMEAKWAIDRMPK